MPINPPISVRGWSEAKLSDLCELISRGKAPQYVAHSTVRAIGQRCIRENGFQGDEARFQDPRRTEGHVFAKSGDVLLNSTGTGTIGRSCVFLGDSDHIVDGHVTVIRLWKEKCSSSFLNSLLKTPWLQRYLEAYCFTGSTNQIELSGSACAEMSISLPSLKEQCTIATILDTLDDAIHKIEASVEKLRRVKAGTLHDLLTRGLDENGELRDRVRHPEQFKESPFGAIPNEWEHDTLEGLTAAPICYGIVQPGPFVPVGVPTLAIKDLYGDYLTGIHRVSPNLDAKYTRSRVKGGDVLLSIKGTIGRVSVVPDLFEGNISRDIARLRPSPKILPGFLNCLLTSQFGQSVLRNTEVGTTRSEISIARLKQITLPVVPIEEQEMIVAAAESVDASIFMEDLGRCKLQQIKTGLMQDLLTGSVRVTNLQEMST